MPGFAALYPTCQLVDLDKRNRR